MGSLNARLYIYVLIISLESKELGSPKNSYAIGLTEFCFLFILVAASRILFIGPWCFIIDLKFGLVVHINHYHRVMMDDYVHIRFIIILFLMMTTDLTEREPTHIILVYRKKK